MAIGRPKGSKDRVQRRMPRREKPIEGYATVPHTNYTQYKVHDIALKLARLGCDPFLGMARIAMNRKHPIELRGKIYAELAQYIAPKRKAIEHSTDLPTLEALLAAMPKLPKPTVIEHQEIDGDDDDD